MHHLHHAGQCTHTVEPFLGRILVARIALGHHRQERILTREVVYQQPSPPTAYQHWDEGIREEYVVSELYER